MDIKLHTHDGRTPGQRQDGATMRRMIGKLNGMLQIRLAKIAALELDFTGSGEPFTASMWRQYEAHEQEVNRLKGALGALRWAVGSTAELDVDVEHSIHLSDRRIQEDRDRARASSERATRSVDSQPAKPVQSGATFGGLTFRYAGESEGGEA